ncbi:NAD(P)-binding protein [Eremomyces bilateralis CBS 781.70]|uniref:NAD(P)-binding protein n=1 Tax=Eremomyces bilateralis CBS 781.70 TaxID=1392243 RepID=A0A6G1G945_9PEZI|nr:NAD(P)-binding protein [Eremomyces bilateralis CBS 781.70]KAF1814597.1 NAD(P)-binding protein [Eremomyces bilateralis CBS 781.70]
MAGPLTGKVALITGGRKGIGKAVALRLAQDRAAVAINYSFDSKAADEVVQQIGDDKAISIQGNAARIPDIERIVQETVQKFGKIDILMANAGVLPMRDLMSTSEADFDQTFALNVKGPYFLAQKAVPHMPEGSRIILVSTSPCASSTVPPNSRDLGRRRILVNALSPGPTGTDLFLKGKSEQVIKALASGNPFNRIAEPEDQADAAAFLAGEGADGSLDRF